MLTWQQRNRIGGDPPLPPRTTLLRRIGCARDRQRAAKRSAHQSIAWLLLSAARPLQGPCPGGRPPPSAKAGRPNIRRSYIMVHHGPLRDNPNPVARYVFQPALAIVARTRPSAFDPPKWTIHFPRGGTGVHSGDRGAASLPGGGIPTVRCKEGRPMAHLLSCAHPDNKGPLDFLFIKELMEHRRLKIPSRIHSPTPMRMIESANGMRQPQIAN